MENKKHISSLKVGILTIGAISILIFTVLWVKGRSLSAGERIDVAFRDVNGMRAGSAVQMMGLRIGQVEEITPVMKGKDSYVKLRFVITEKGINIPPASSISIQQSGIIGEQFLEVTPPKIRDIYVETTKNTTNIKKDMPIYMELSEGEEKIGKITNAQVISRNKVPDNIKLEINTPNALKMSYYVDLPGLVLDDNIEAKIKGGKVIFYEKCGEIIKTPSKDLKYTVIEPLRLSELMDLGLRATRAMLDTNDKINEILSDNFIDDLKGSVENIAQLTKNANTTLDKANILIDESKKEITNLIKESEELVESLTELSDNLNKLISDETLKNDVVSSIKSIGKMSDNINKVLEEKQTQEIISDVSEISRNLAEISAYINEYTKDEKLKEDIKTTVGNLSAITTNIAKVMSDYNKLEDCDKLKLKDTIKDVSVITKNVKKFSEKLNKRFLLFRLMF